MAKRSVLLFFTLIFGFSGILARLASLATTQPLAAAAGQQSTATLEVVNTRGTIYDCNFLPLTGIDRRELAAVFPTEESADRLLRATDPRERSLVLEQLQSLRPFVREVEHPLYGKGLQSFSVPIRYRENQPALHLLGQVEPGGGGISGLELAYEELLTASGGSIRLRYPTDARGRYAEHQPPERLDTVTGNAAGLVLTLDRRIQEIAEAAAKALPVGAILVMNPHNGDILAAVSRPTFSPLAPAASLSAPDAPFLNRNFAAYSVGSTFKMLVAATALDGGYSIHHTVNCKGGVEIGGRIFHCHNLAGHGKIDLQAALSHSCNPYFISLALELGGSTLLRRAEQLGFGTAWEAAPHFQSDAGTLPTAAALSAAPATANFGFGQGALTATPVQIAVLTAAMANGGNAVTPRLVRGNTEDGKTLAAGTTSFSPRPVFSPATAELMRQLLCTVVESGSGRAARPSVGGAGGKTASAQTGQYREGEEVVHAWFTGFYPAVRPEYVIVVLAEGGESGGDAACPIFREITEQIGESILGHSPLPKE